jgi:hypothetical protein
MRGANWDSSGRNLVLRLLPTLAFLPRDTRVPTDSLLVRAYTFPRNTPEHTRFLVTCTSMLACSLFVCFLGRNARLADYIRLASHSQTPIYSGHSALGNSSHDL